MLFTAINEALATLYPCLVDPPSLAEPWLDGVKLKLKRDRRPSADWRQVSRLVSEWMLRFDRLSRVPEVEQAPDSRWRTGDVLGDRMKLVQCLDERATDHEPETLQRQQAQTCFELADRLLDYMIDKAAAQITVIDDVHASSLS